MHRTSRFAAAKGSPPSTVLPQTFPPSSVNSNMHTGMGMGKPQRRNNPRKSIKGTETPSLILAVSVLVCMSISLLMAALFVSYRGMVWNHLSNQKMTMTTTKHKGVHPIDRLLDDYFPDTTKANAHDDEFDDLWRVEVAMAELQQEEAMGPDEIKSFLEDLRKPIAAIDGGERETESENDPVANERMDNKKDKSTENDPKQQAPPSPPLPPPRELPPLIPESES